MTTIADHNDIRLQPIKRVTREENPQVSDGNRQRAGSLQAKDQCQPSLDGVLARADWPVQQRGAATHARYGCPGQASTYAPGCTVGPRAGSRLCFASRRPGPALKRARRTYATRPLSAFVFRPQLDTALRRVKDQFCVDVDPRFGNLVHRPLGDKPQRPFWRQRPRPPAKELRV